MPSATVNGAKLVYQWDGEATKPVLVLSNSLTTDMRMWEPMIQAFTEHFRVLRYNNRGHGGSSSPAGEYSLDDIAGDALGLFNHLDIASAQFCGLSMGGMVGMWLGLHARERLKKLVICNTSSDVGSPEPWTARIGAIKEGGMAAIAEAGVERFLSEEYRSTGGSAVEMVRDMLMDCDAEGYCGCIAAVRDMSLTDQLDQISNDVLVIAGEVDLATPVSHSEIIVDRIPRAKLKVIPGVSHLSCAEKPHELSRIVLDYLQGKGAG